MRVLEVNKQEEWPSQQASFAQSWEWGEILKKEGKDVARLAISDDGEPIAHVQLAYIGLPFGWRYAFCPKGPAVEISNIYDALCEYLKKQGCIFFRIEPGEKFPISLLRSGQAPIFKFHKTIDINPPATIILSLEKSEEEILLGMHPKTRYNIRLAEKKGLAIKYDKDFSSFIKLMKQTGRRDKFKLHNEKHYREAINSEMSRQITIFFGKDAVATAVFVGAGETFTYLYGASDYEHRNLMAPYMAQWEGIKLGKRLGFKKYDFFGVAPSENQISNIKNQKEEELNNFYSYDEEHQYAGVTRFKLGFGGEPEKDAGTFDLIIDEKKYLAYQLLRRVRRIF